MEKNRRTLVVIAASHLSVAAGQEEHSGQLMNLLTWMLADPHVVQNRLDERDLARATFFESLPQYLETAGSGAGELVMVLFGAAVLSDVVRRRGELTSIIRAVNSKTNVARRPVWILCDNGVSSLQRDLEIIGSLDGHLATVPIWSLNVQSGSRSRMLVLTPYCADYKVLGDKFGAFVRSEFV